MKLIHSPFIQNSTYRLYIISISVLFILSVVIEKGQDVLWINSRHSPFLDTLLTVVTNLGDGLIFIPIIIVLLFVRFQYAFTAAVIGLSHGVLVSILKQVIFPSFERPKNFIDHELLYFVPGINVHSVHSFPSGHTTTAFCLALFIALIINKRSVNILLLMIALLVGYSRIYLLQHFLMDVAAGAVLGSATTLIVWESIRTAPQPPWMDFQLRIRIRLDKKVRRLSTRSLTAR